MRTYLVETFMKPYYKKRLFGSAFIYLNDYINQSAILSMYCLTLGFRYKDDFGVLLELLGNSKSVLESNINGLSQIAERMENKLTVDVKNAYDLYSEIEIKEIMTLYFNDKDLDHRNPADLLKIKNEKIPLIVVATLTEMMIYKMMGYGYRYPNKTKELLTYKIDESDYALALKSGLDIPKKQEVFAIEDHLNFAKELIKPYVFENRPDLINRLGL